MSDIKKLEALMQKAFEENDILIYNTLQYYKGVNYTYESVLEKIVQVQSGEIKELQTMLVELQAKTNVPYN